MVVFTTLSQMLQNKENQINYTYPGKSDLVNHGKSSLFNFKVYHLSSHLCCYRKGYSTQQVLISVIQTWRISSDGKGYDGRPVLMDLSKAFDTINHDILILNTIFFFENLI